MENKEPSWSDEGTRLQHLQEYRESLEIVIGILKDRGLRTPEDKQKVVEFAIASRVLQVTIDSVTGYSHPDTEGSLYDMFRGFPKAEDIEGGRGTPLNDTRGNQDRDSE